MITARAFGSFGLALPLAAALMATSLGCSQTSSRMGATNAKSPAAEPVSTTTLTGGELPTETAEELPPMASLAQVSDRRPVPSGQQARLVVSEDIVSHCPNVQMMGDRDFTGPSEEAWVAVLGSVAACLNKGDLGAKDIRVTGPNEGSTAVGYVLSKLGVDLARVEAVDDFEEDLCIHDHSCVVSTVRIEAVDKPVDEGTHL